MLKIVYLFKLFYLNKMKSFTALICYDMWHMDFNMANHSTCAHIHRVIQYLNDFQLMGNIICWINWPSPCTWDYVPPFKLIPGGSEG